MFPWTPQFVNAHNVDYADAQGHVSVAEGSVNCAAATGADVSNWALYGGAFVITHHNFRLKAGNPKNADGSPKGLSTQGMLDAFTALGVTATRHYGEDINLARDALIEGHAVCAAIHYPTLDTNYPELSGDHRFDGEHMLPLFGWRAGTHRTKTYDSTLDGRYRNGHRYPQGPLSAPFRAYRQAMQDFQIVVNGSTYSVSEVYGANKGVFLIAQL